jgi:hypothetical protein
MEVFRGNGAAVFALDSGGCSRPQRDETDLQIVFADTLRVLALGRLVASRLGGSGLFG